MGHETITSIVLKGSTEGVTGTIEEVGLEVELGTIGTLTTPSLVVLTSVSSFSSYSPSYSPYLLNISKILHHNIHLHPIFLYFKFETFLVQITCDQLRELRSTSYYAWSISLLLFQQNTREYISMIKIVGDQHSPLYKQYNPSNAYPCLLVTCLYGELVHLGTSVAIIL